MGDRDDKYRARKAFVSKQARLRRQELVNEHKGTRCHDCGGSFDPICIDLEHVDPRKKVASISWLVRNGTLRALRAELKKVIPVCAVCHRLRTAYGPGRMES